MDRKIEAVIFDWAGTTVDYGCFAPVQAFLEVFREAGIEPEIDEVREPMGMLKREHIHTMLHMPRIRNLWREKYGREPEREDTDALYARFEPALLKILDRFSDLKPYVAETVQALRERNIRVGSTTGYTDIMMDRVVPRAAEQGYAPDCWYSPDSVGGMGRPYPYMIFRNMERLQIASVASVMKVGDTVSDIREGKNAGVFTVGILEGSSALGLSESEYRALPEGKKQELLKNAEDKFLRAGADAVVKDIRGILEYL